MATATLKSRITNFKELALDNYSLYILFIVLSSVILRLIISQLIPVSAFGTDDFGYIHKSIHYPQGDFFMGGLSADKQNQYGGLLYPLLISAWRLFDSVYLRTQIIFFINSLCAAGTTWCCIALCRRETGQKSLLLPLYCATIPSLFLFTFAALTENLLFLAVALVANLLSAYSRNQSPLQLALAAICACSAPLVRQPGFAIVGGFVAALLIMGTDKKFSRWLVAIFTTVCSIGLSFGISHYIGALLGKDREAMYVKNIKETLDSIEELSILASLAIHQLIYIFVACAIFPLLGWFPLCRLNIKKLRSPEATCFIYAVCSSALFILFCLAHLIIKLDLRPEQSSFIYGRYNDPTLICLAPLGLCFFLHAQSQTFKRGTLKALGICGITFFALYQATRCEGTSLNIAGFYAICRPTQPIFLIVLCSLLVFLSLAGPLQMRKPLVGLFVIGFNVLTIGWGINHLYNRAGALMIPLFSAEALTKETDNQSCVTYDMRVRHKKAFSTHVQMTDIYREMEFATYPRQQFRTTNPAEFKTCRYLFTLKESPVENSEWSTLWTLTDYILYKRID